MPSEIIQLGIPVKTTSINVPGLHPEIRDRVRRALQDKRLKGLARVSSGARTHALQTLLYQRYKAGNGPLAANPNYRNPSTGRVGSAHQVQSAGGYSRAGLNNDHAWAYAVDIGFYGTVQSKLLRETLEDYGMVANLWTAGEWWHYVPQGSSSNVISGQGMSGSSAVSTLQKRLGVTSDGIHGPKTSAAIAKLQSKLGQFPSGDWLKTDENAWGRSIQDASQGTAAKTTSDQIGPRNALAQIQAILDRVE